MKARLSLLVVCATLTPALRAHAGSSYVNGTNWGTNGTNWGTNGTNWGTNGTNWGTNGTNWGTNGTGWGTVGTSWGVGGKDWSSEGYAIGGVMTSAVGGMIRLSFISGSNRLQIQKCTAASGGTCTSYGTAVTGSALVGNTIKPRKDSSASIYISEYVGYNFPVNGDYIEEFRVLASRDGASYSALCAYSGPTQMAAFFTPGSWNRTTGTVDWSGVSLVCESAGAIPKCAQMGYRPWKRLTVNGTVFDEKYMADLQQSCTRMIRADYCGDGASHTENGHRINVYDMLPGQFNMDLWPTTVAQPQCPNGTACPGMVAGIGGVLTGPGRQTDTESWAPEALWSPEGAWKIHGPRFATLASPQPSDGSGNPLLYLDSLLPTTDHAGCWNPTTRSVKLPVLQMPGGNVSSVSTQVVLLMNEAP